MCLKKKISPAQTLESPATGGALGNRTKDSHILILLFADHVFMDTYTRYLAPIPLPFLLSPYTLKCLCIHMAKHLKPHSMG